jgi:transcriptional regulator with XRE-family HTH domain
MKIESNMTDEQILENIGERLAQLRLEKNLTQRELAYQAGVGIRTVQRMETGSVSIQFSGFLRICRVLDLIEKFELLIPEPIESPITKLKQRGKKRQRASGRTSANSKSVKWKWGDES